MLNVRIVELRTTAEGIMARVGQPMWTRSTPGGDPRLTIERTVEVPLAVADDGTLKLDTEELAQLLKVNVGDLLVPLAPPEDALTLPTAEVATR